MLNSKSLQVHLRPLSPDFRLILNILEEIVVYIYIASTTLVYLQAKSSDACRNGSEYISTIEAKNYPFFGTQWHPEKPPYEFSLTAIPHTRYGRFLFMIVHHPSGDLIKQ